MIKLIVVIFAGLALCRAGDDKDRDASQMIIARGFESKTYNVQTSDGYILTMFRITNTHWTGKTKKTILFQHGLTGNSDYWMQNTPGKLSTDGKYIEESGVTTDCSAVNASAVGNTMPFVLSSCGYDIWLGNNRGTRYSTGHVKYDMTKDSEYWNYNIDTLMHDIIAEINFIKTETKSDTIGYVGHSMGTTQMLQLLSENEEFNKVIKPFIAVAPVAYVGHVPAMDKAVATLEPLFNPINGPFFLLPSNKLKYADHLLSDVCGLPLVKELCESIVMLITGWNFQDNNSKYYPDRVAHGPDDTSFKVAAHMAQRALGNTFSKFDYHLTNLVHYGHVFPPKYELSKITNENIIFISGENDLLATPKDVEHMRTELKVKLYEDYVVPDTKFNHMDFIWAENSGKLVNAKILTWLEKLN